MLTQRSLATLVNLYTDPTILFIGPVTTQSAWGDSCREYIKSILTFSHRVCVKDVYMGGGRIKPEQDMVDLQNTRYDKFDYVIQMCLPSLFYKDYRFKKNVGIFFSECKHHSESPIYRHAAMMDHIMVPSDYEVASLSEADVDVSSIGIPFDSSVVDKTYEDVRPKLGKDKDTYIFYTIAEDNERKNLDGLIRSYMTAFSSRDNVSLVVKTNRDIDDRILAIQKSLRIREPSTYPHMMTITDRLPKKNIYSLHQSCDCFVTMTRGEAWCVPAMEALAFNNLIIYPQHLGLDTMLADTDNIPLIFGSLLEYCDVKNPPMENIYTGLDCWRTPSNMEMIQHMQEVVKNKTYGSPEPDVLARFSHKEVGKRIKKCLES